MVKGWFENEIGNPASPAAVDSITSTPLTAQSTQRKPENIVIE